MKAKRFCLVINLGVCLALSATAWAEDVVYVVNSYVHGASPSWSTVSMVRNDTFAILKTLEIGDNAHTVAVSPDQSQLWVTCPASNEIYIIDGPTFETTRVLDLGAAPAGPMGAAFTPDGTRVYVTLSDTGTVNVYDAATAALVAAITVGGLPNFITFTPDGSKAYVSCYQGPPPQVVAIRTSDNAVLATRTFEGNTIQDAVVSPDGSRVYISNMDRQRIEVIRTSDDTVLAPIPTAHLRPRGIGISPDGAYLFVGYYLAIDALIEMIRLSDNAVVSSVPIPSNPRWIAVKSNGRRIVVSEHNEDELYAYTVDGASLTFTARVDLNTVPGSSASPVAAAFGGYPSPLPDIRLNGVDGPVTLTPADSIRLSLHLDPNGRHDDADWFLVCVDPFRNLWFWSPASGWGASWIPAVSGPLAPLAEFRSPEIPLAGFPPGWYWFYFAVDVKMDSLLSWLYLYADAAGLHLLE